VYAMAKLCSERVSLPKKVRIEATQIYVGKQ